MANSKPSSKVKFDWQGLLIQMAEVGIPLLLEQLVLVLNEPKSENREKLAKDFEKDLRKELATRRKTELKAKKTKK